MAPPSVCDPCACSPAQLLGFASNEQTFRTAVLTILCQILTNISMDSVIAPEIPA